MSSKAKRPVQWTEFEEFEQITVDDGKTYHTLPEGTRFFKNSLYSVTLQVWYRVGLLPIFHLSIRSNDRAPARDWRHFQRIKNELIGKEVEAIEMYPAESRKVDEANQYHLFGVWSSEFRWPFGFTERFVTDGRLDVKSPAKQRPLEESDGERTATAAGTLEVILPQFVRDSK